mmetsp:Transcript_96547/g.273015  ORF Transcript_96547/g.273015 Transcript_96547/m.273015 type:complete len:309 (-) Transcript_96547:178-1104(-)
MAPQLAGADEAASPPHRRKQRGPPEPHRGPHQSDQGRVLRHPRVAQRHEPTCQLDVVRHERVREEGAEVHSQVQPAAGPPGGRRRLLRRVGQLVLPLPRSAVAHRLPAGGGAQPRELVPDGGLLRVQSGQADPDRRRGCHAPAQRHCGLEPRGGLGGAAGQHKPQLRLGGRIRALRALRGDGNSRECGPSAPGAGRRHQRTPGAERQRRRAPGAERQRRLCAAPGSTGPALARPASGAGLAGACGPGRAAVSGGAGRAMAATRSFRRLPELRQGALARQPLPRADRGAGVKVARGHTQREFLIARRTL